MTKTDEIYLTVETMDEGTFNWPANLGTDLEQAKEIAEEIFHARNNSPLPRCDRAQMATRTIGVHANNKLYVYDGEWFDS